MRTTRLIYLLLFLLSPLAASACPCLALEADGKMKASMIFTGEAIAVEILAISTSLQPSGSSSRKKALPPER